MRRWTFRIMFFLILGGVTTVGVAWACAAWSPMGRYISSQLNGAKEEGRYPQRTLHIHRRPEGEVADLGLVLNGSGCTRIVWVMDGEVGTFTFNGREQKYFTSDVPRLVFDFRFGRGPEILHEVPFRWSVMRGREVAGPATPTWYALEDATGWPVAALRSSATAASFDRLLQGMSETTDSIVIAKDASIPGSYGSYRALPLVPMWPGSLIDTLFYAAIWFAIFFGFASARRMIRRRRGRCPECNYQLHGQIAEVRGQMSEISKGCPECGWNRSEPRP